MTYQVGQKVVVHKIPGRYPTDFVNNQFPPIMEIVALSEDMILLETPDSMFSRYLGGGDEGPYGWCLQENPEEFRIVQAQKCDTKVLYTKVDYVAPHPESGPGLPQATLGLEQEVKSLCDGTSHRIIASNAHNETYLIEDSDGQKVTLDLLKKMDICIGPVVPPVDWDNRRLYDYRCRFVKVQDGLLLDEETKQQYQVVES